jgi:hypothetical protein
VEVAAANNVIVHGQDVWRGMFVAYEAALWKSGPYSYLNRAWCRCSHNAHTTASHLISSHLISSHLISSHLRIEMFFASHVPLRPDIDSRVSNFQAGLRYAVSCGRRPHLLYSPAYP